MTTSTPQELKLVPPGCCPTCGQKLPTTARRVCAACGGPILRGHKFFFDGSTVKHRLCDEPDAYNRQPKEG